MPRGPKPTKALFIVGRVRVVRGKNGHGFRVLWYEGKRQRERTATTFEEAKLIAREEDARLDGLEGSGTLSPETPFGALVLHAVDPRRHQWSENWAARMLRYANLHVRQRIGQIPCSRLDKADIVAVLEAMVDGGYSRHTIDKVRKVMARAVEEGVRRGVWQPGRHPMVGVRTPNGGGDGRPNRELIPTQAQVEELITRMREDRPIYGVMAEVAAFTGVRWGELLALRRDVVDLDAGTLTINLVCVENEQGRFRFQKPSKTGAARSVAPPRTVLLEGRLVALFANWVESLPVRPRGPHIDGDYPEGLLFTARNGNPIRRSAWSKVFRRHTSQIDGWPEGASWHYLRHFCATRWINPPPAGLGIEVPTVSKMLGHANVSTTYEWYVDTDAEALARARERMQAAGEGAG